MTRLQSLTIPGIDSLHVTATSSFFLRRSLQIGTVAAVILILVLRGPDRIVHAQLWAEDGSVFFQDAYNLGFWESITKTYRGYYHVLPRILAEFAMLLRLDLVPTFFALSSLIVIALCCCMFLLNHFTYFMPSLPLRALFCILLAALPATDEVLLRFVNIQWYLSVFCMLLVIMRPPEKWTGRTLYVLAWVLAGLTVPMAMIFVPCLFIKGQLEPRNRTTVIVACGLVALIMLVVIKEALTTTPEGNMARDPAAMPVALVNIFAYHVLAAATLGSNRIQTILGQDHTALIYLWLLPFVVLNLSILVHTYQRKKWDALVIWSYLIYCMIAPIVLTLVGRPSLISEAPSFGNPTYGARYYVVAVAALYLAILWCVNRYLTNTRWSIPVMSVTCVMLLIPIQSDFALSKLSDWQWSAEARRIEAAESRGAGTTITIPLPPYSPWAMSLQVPPQRALHPWPLPIASQPVAGHFDGVLAVESDDMTRVGRQFVRAIGWAADPSGNRPASVILIVDRTSSQIVARTYTSVERSDVSELSGRPELLQSGWDVIFSVEHLEPGAHTFQAFVLDERSGRAFLIPGESVVDVMRHDSGQQIRVAR
jgi:hypothetical protein